LSKNKLRCIIKEKEVIAMDTEKYGIKDVDIEKLVPFKLHSSQTYGGERLGQLMGSIEKSGLINPIIVRPIADGESMKYEIICGHNRTNAVRELGRETISAVVREGLSDEEAIELYYDSNLNQQSFADWNYTQKIEAVKYYDKRIKDISQQGKRNDLEKGVESKTVQLLSTLDRSQEQAPNKALPGIKWHATLAFPQQHLANIEVLLNCQMS